MATAASLSGVGRNGKVRARWSEHYRRLCAERDRLAARDCCAPGAPRVKLHDFAEAASDESQVSLSFVVASATRDTILEVLAAIRRIERGTYGICELTGKPIEPERLLAMPWARYSLEGQRKLESSERGTKHAPPKPKASAEASEGTE